MEIGNNKIETIDGKMLWTPKGFYTDPEGTIETITISKEFIPSDADISAKLDELLGKPTLIEELTKLVIKDEQERYIRELLIRDKELQAEVEQLKAELESMKEKLNKYLNENSNRYIYQDLLGEDWYFSDLDIFNEIREIVNKAEGKYETR